MKYTMKVGSIVATAVEVKDVTLEVEMSPEELSVFMKDYLLVLKDLIHTEEIRFPNN